MNSSISSSNRLRYISAVILFLTVATQIFANATTPKKGSEERKAILDAVRAPLESAIIQKVIFVVDHVKVEGNWAFFMGTPKSKTGGPIDYNGTKYEVDADEADEMTVALLQKKAGKWTLVEHAYFTTDVWWDHLWKRHKGCPESIFVGNTNAR